MRERDEYVDQLETRLARPEVGGGQLREQREPQLGPLAQHARRCRHGVARDVEGGMQIDARPENAVGSLWQMLILGGGPMLLVVVLLGFSWLSRRTSGGLAAGGTPAGSVTFTDGATTLATNVAVNASGVATFSPSTELSKNRT